MGEEEWSGVGADQSAQLLTIRAFIRVKVSWAQDYHHYYRIAVCEG